MADKSIVDLPQLSEVTDATLIPVYQPNSDNPAQKMPSSVFRNWAEDAVFPAAKMAQEASAVAVGAEAGAKQAWTGVQNAIKSIPAGSTPIVNDLTTGGTRMALSAEMGKVLGRRPNPNLIDNWYFPDPVNQRGQTSYGGTTNKYTIDRWRVTNANTTVAVNSDGITITGAPGATPYLQQLLKSPSKYLGCQVTLSVLTKNGTLSKATSTLPKAFPSAATLYCNVANVCDILVTGTTISVRLKAPAGGSIGVVAAKLELGDTQTFVHLDDNGNWVLNELPDKSEELLKCCMNTADSSDTYANNMKTANAVGALALNGSNAMTGALAVNGNYANVNGNANRAQLRFHPDPSDLTNAYSISLYGSEDINTIARIYSINNGAEKQYNILHTGNKPRGSYTGNGSAGGRLIKTGGIGNMLLIWSTTGKAFVTPGGGLCSIGTTITNFAANVAKFENGELFIATTDQTMNTNGQTYHYQVL